MSGFTLGIIEDEIMVLRLLGALCDQESAGKVLFLADSARSAWTNLSVAVPDVLLVDINLPDDDGIALALAIRRKYPSVKSIMLTAECSEYTVNRVRQSGLNGYVDKSEDPDAVLRALTEVMVHDRLYFSRMGKEVAMRTARDQNSFTKVLSDRELELLPLLGMGLSDEAVAEQLAMTGSAVKKHRENIMRKLNVHKSADLVHFCLKKGFIRARPEGGARPSTQPPFA